MLRNLRNNLVRLRNASSEKMGNLRNKSSTGKTPPFLIFRYWVYIIRKFFVMSWANWSSENGTWFLDLPTYLLWPQTSLFLKLTTQWVMGLKIEKNIEYNCDLFHYLFLNLFEIRRIEILWWYMPDIGCKMIH